MVRNRYLLLFAMVVLSLSVINPPSTAGPELAFPGGQEIDLGKTTEGQLRIGGFTIKNVGDEELALKNYIITCGCLKLMKRKTPTLTPGESFNLKFIFDTSGLAGKKARKSIIVFSNADDAPNRLYVTTKVMGRKSYQVDPGEITEEFDIFVDVRPPEAYGAGHIIGAINVPAVKFADWLQKVPDGVTVYIYSENGRKSDELVENLQKDSRSELRSLIGGFVQWKHRHETYITN